MPGTIHVTVLEFKGASSSSNPSAKSLKVSMGKKYHQTWDKGDFSFPVTKLKEDLIVKLLDAGENEIAHADIRTIQVIEKGYWDEVFSLEGEGGGGHVHMKLQFVLSDEERKRIRLMRETAMKKKQETNPTFNLRLSDSSDAAVQTSTRGDRKISDTGETFVQIDVIRPEVEASQADVSLNSPTSSGDSPCGSEIPIIAVDKGASFSPVIHEIQAEEPAQVHQSIEIEKKSEDERSNKSQNRVPQKLSSNIRKMISAFETSEIQEAKSAPKAPKIVVQPVDRSFKKSKNDNLNENLHQTPVEVITRADTEMSRAAVELEPSSTPSPSNVENIFRKDQRELIVKEIGKSPSDASRQSTLETATNSGGIDEEQSREALNVDHDIAPIEPIVKELEHSSSDRTRQSTSERKHEEQSREGSYVEDISIEALSEPIVKEMEKSVVYETGQSTLETSTSLGRNKQSRESDLKVGANSNEKQKSLEYYEEENYSSESSGIWIFPDNTRRLCITTAGDPTLETKHHEQTKVSPKPEMLEKKNTASPKESGSGGFPDVSFNGLVGQVIKVVAILGFGVLVFLTRQKEPRKKNREENVRLYTIPRYIDGTTLIE